MSAVRPLLRGELLKLRTSRLTWLLLGAMALVIVVFVVLSLSNLNADQVAGARGVRRVLTIGAGVACFFTLTLGVVGLAGEYRHHTIGQALLAAPARWPVVVAKVLAYAAAGLVFGLVALVITLAVGAPGLAADDAGISYSGAPMRLVAVGTLASAGLFAAIGVGLAALLRDQVLALSVGLGWMVLIDTLAVQLVPSVGRFFPGGAVASLLHSQTDDVHAPGVGALLLLAYALIFAAAGAHMARRRDLAQTRV